MNYIGSNHFLDQLEKLPNEEVVWEGGSSYRGVAIDLFRTISVFLVIAAIVTLAINLPEILVIKNPDYVAQPAKTSGIDKNKEATAQKKKIKKVPKEIFNTALINKFLMLGALVLLFLIPGIIWLRIKNYWFVVTTERICIQHGIFTRQTMAIDIDKIVSVISTHTLLDRLFKVHSIEIIHAGVLSLRAQQGLIFSNPYKMPYVLTSTRLASQLLNNWLPRDNHSSR